MTPALQKPRVSLLLGDLQILGNKSQRWHVHLVERAFECVHKQLNRELPEVGQQNV
jgi:hypothetical protein